MTHRVRWGPWPPGKGKFRVEPHSKNIQLQIAADTWQIEWKSDSAFSQITLFLLLFVGWFSLFCASCCTVQAGVHIGEHLAASYQTECDCLFPSDWPFVIRMYSLPQWKAMWLFHHDPSGPCPGGVWQGNVGLWRWTVRILRSPGSWYAYCLVDSVTKLKNTVQPFWKSLRKCFDKIVDCHS